MIAATKKDTRNNVTGFVCINLAVDFPLASCACLLLLKIALPLPSCGLVGASLLLLPGIVTRQLVHVLNSPTQFVERCWISEGHGWIRQDGGPNRLPRPNSKDTLAVIAHQGRGDHRL